MNNPERLIRFDWAMKKILRDKANFDILEGFLSALLKTHIVIEDILESESSREEEKQKFYRVDLLVRDSRNQLIIIEVQAETESDYLERLVFGTSKTIVDNLNIGQPYSSIKKVISISIMYFNLGSGKDYLYHGRTEFKGVHDGEILQVRQVSKITDENNRAVRLLEPKPDIYPEYYLIEVERFEDIIREDVDEWVYFFKHEEIKDSFHSRNIQKAREKLKILRMNGEERRAYEKYLMLLASERDSIRTSRAEGHEEGWEKGWTEGMTHSILTILKQYGSIPAALEQKIMEQNDQNTLQQWLEYAAQSKDISDFELRTGSKKQ